MPVPNQAPESYEETCKALQHQAHQMTQGTYEAPGQFIDNITTLAGVLRPEDRQKLAERVQQLA